MWSRGISCSKGGSGRGGLQDSIRGGASEGLGEAACFAEGGDLGFVRAWELHGRALEPLEWRPRHLASVALVQAAGQLLESASWHGFVGGLRNSTVTLTLKLQSDPTHLGCNARDHGERGTTPQRGPARKQPRGHPIQKSNGRDTPPSTQDQPFDEAEACKRANATPASSPPFKSHPHRARLVANRKPILHQVAQQESVVLCWKAV